MPAAASDLWHPRSPAASKGGYELHAIPPQNALDPDIGSLGAVPSRPAVSKHLAAVVAMAVMLPAGCSEPPDGDPGETADPWQWSACADTAYETLIAAHGEAFRIPDVDVALDVSALLENADGLDGIRARGGRDNPALMAQRTLAARVVAGWHTGDSEAASGWQPPRWAEIQAGLRDALWCLAREHPGRCGGWTGLDIRSARLSEPLGSSSDVGPLLADTENYYTCYIEAAGR